MAQTITTVDQYIAQFPPERQEILQKVRAAIRAGAPQATEKITWQMPTYWQGENLVHFANGKHHIGFYPAPEAIVAFAGKLAEYNKGDRVTMTGRVYSSKPGGSVVIKECRRAGGQ